MSSPASAVTVDLPRWLLAERLSLGLACATAPVVEAVLARHPGAPTGAGLAVAALLVAGAWFQRRRRPRSLALPAGPGSRLLGSSVVVRWQSPGRSGSLWLTPADLPRETLRSLAVRLVAGR
jgi:hypothetical protein